MNHELRIVSRMLGVTLGVFLAVSFSVLGNADKGAEKTNNPYISVVSAEDDEDGEEEEDEEDDEDRDDDQKKGTASTETQYVTVTHYEVRYVPRTVVVIPDEYRSDRDGDALVDALDPDPDTHQREYFTDDDNDTDPNVFDRHKDEDDFAYFDSMYDTNDDGIIDDFESLARE